jgi:two-component system chemotaxis response regulator CheY
MRVLVVDDDVVSRMMLMHLIDACGGHEILEAEDGEDAWRQLDAGLAPAMVFCDLRMPRLSGMGLLERVRADSRLARLPFVLVSAAGDAATMEDAAGKGVDGYIVKPFQGEDVRLHIERLAALEQGLNDAPLEVARRLGIDAARLELYLDGLLRQLHAAGGEIAALQEDAGMQRARLGRLRDGCATLGLRDAAARLDQLVKGPDQAFRAEPVDGALQIAIAAARRQLQRLRSA